MAKGIVWSQRARSDLRDIYDYISKDSEVYAFNVVSRIINVVENILSFPFFGRSLPEFDIENLRERLSGNYRIGNLQKIEIVTIHHSSRILK
ncbi:type II toxin-antitoxin system RelE/ParE family toxin [Leptospira kmetyi]|uniref:Type II toxin-antitoxin system mRNA interferase toxin, RelE/StbE family n=1 Tax=Leptospira kmetyi TaxID=408139 RepID=A0ABX4N7T2_9LEPT|nr:type II toxin-antitoxin system RelE/ParE family toxin [Leptospira kmetyi]PJZ29449.1 type II toxin-antitoxin system mRNA interferase toxin, RelE/StbE family [Leptospira kmetyi]TGK16730.1 type II toxin-antitoxin system RelE/ParE family toxin [Leptospira kmetyi]TGK30838.1 type II toxin-antitoxin system RelE/ParE family toxin [Leptospira kmetyi]